jgi:hypothetical protein
MYFFSSVTRAVDLSFGVAQPATTSVNKSAVPKPMIEFFDLMSLPFFFLLL